MGGNILKGLGVLDDLSWDDAGKLTNNGGIGIDDEKLISLRVIYKTPEPLTILGTGVVLCAIPVLKKEYAKRKKKKDGDA